MPVRITLSDDEPPPPGGSVLPPATRIERRKPSAPVFADWDDTDVPALLLFLSDEPELGRRFSYSGVEWEIVDYRDGWIARLLVD